MKRSRPASPPQPTNKEEHDATFPATTSTATSTSTSTTMNRDTKNENHNSATNNVTHKEEEKHDEASDSIRDQDKCWKCLGHGRKRKSCNSTSFTGKICPVCQGSGQRPASKRSLELAQQPGKIIPLRGRNGLFAGRRAVGGSTSDSSTASTSTSTPTPIVKQGELMAALGCGDWRLFQLANGHKLTVDDFICAWVAAEETRKRGYGSVQAGPFGQDHLTLTNTTSSSSSSSSNNDNDKIFHHADLGCGCGSVLMTLAWAFPDVIRSHGVEAQAVSFDLCRRGLQWNLGLDGSTKNDDNDDGQIVQLSHEDLRSWKGGSRAPYDLITGTPPYFPADRFVASENHSQKIRCRVPTRGAAADYVAAASRLVKPDIGVICIVETARQEGEDGMRQAILEHGLEVVRRLDIITRTGLPPRFSCWVLTKPSGDLVVPEDANKKEGFPIETLTIRNKDQTRTLEYVEAMEKMGWVDFEQTKEKRIKTQQED